MLEGNRRILIAIGFGGIIACIIGIVTWPNTRDLDQFVYSDAQNQEFRPGGSECEPKAIASIRDSGARAIKADDCAQSAEDYRQNTSDLVQQTRAANAAEAQAAIANQSIWMAWFQTLGGFITLCAAVAAAVYARDAAKEGRNSATTARDHYEAMRKIEAPVIDLKFRESPTFFIENEKLHLKFGINIVNIGRSSAWISAVHIESQKKKYFTFFVDPGKEASPSITEIILIEDSDIIGYVEYSMPLELGLRRTFKIETVVNANPWKCEAILRPAALLRKDDERYNNPFQKNELPSS